MTTRRWATLAALSPVLLLLMSSSSSARWTDVARAPVGQLTLGTVDIDPDNPEAPPTTETPIEGDADTIGVPKNSEVEHAFDNMAPGDAISIEVTLINGAPQSRRYSLLIDAPDQDLHDAFAVDVAVGRCAEVSFPEQPAEPGRDVILGDPTPGPQAGDRTLEPGAAETLCLRYTLELDAGNDLAGRNTRTQLLVWSETIVD